MNTKKKIGVLTILPRNNNYGGILQGYALTTFLKQLGFEVYLISRIKNRPSFKSKLKKFVKEVILRQKIVDNYSVISQNMIYFEEKYIQPRTELIQSDREFSLLKKYNFDSVIVGSDQVWRKAFNDDRKANFFLNFIDDSNITKIAYAASFGVNTWDYNPIETKYYSQLIRSFKAVSVREESGIQLCRENLNIEAKVMIDPTMLLTPSDYTALAEAENEPESSGELLYYFLSPDSWKTQILEMATSELEMTKFSVNRISNNSQAPIKDQIYPTVTAWLKGFKDAQFVVTDSFHGCAFSILFNIPFVVCSNQSGGNARFETLLRTFRLEHRFIHNNQPVQTSILKESINWDFVNSILEDKRKASIEFLTSNILN